MKKVIRLTENELYNIIHKAVTNVVNECDGAAVGGGTTGAIGGGATGTNTVGGADTKYQYTVPFGTPLRKGKKFYQPALERDSEKGISVNQEEDD